MNELMYVFMYVCVCMYVHMYVCIDVCMPICVCRYVHMDARVYAYCLNLNKKTDKPTSSLRPDVMK